MLTLVQALLCFLLVSAVLAQAPARNDAVFRYRGADRDARLVERAKQEGRVVLYTSLAPTESKPLADAFEKKYGIKVELWRALSDQVVQRVITEARGRRHAVDVVETNGPEMEMLAREKLLAEFHSPHLADLPAQAIPRHRTWFPDRMNFYVVGYNTTKVQRSQIPATYEGFADPKWKGRIGLEATDAEWMATLIKTWGADEGHGLLPQAVGDEAGHAQGPHPARDAGGGGRGPGRPQHVQQQHRAAQAQGRADRLRAGAARRRASRRGSAWRRNAPHPHAALLFADYVLSPAGQSCSNRSAAFPRARASRASCNNFPFIVIDPATALDEKDKWEKLWNDLFLKQ